VFHPLAIGFERRVGGIDVGFDYHPQQSVLKPHAGHRQTACIRYISFPQRSQSVFSSAGRVVMTGDTSGLGGRGGGASGMAAIIAREKLARL